MAHQAPLSMEFPRQEYRNGLPFASLGDLPSPGIEPSSPALAGGFFTTEPPGKSLFNFQFLCESCLPRDLKNYIHKTIYISTSDL